MKAKLCAEIMVVFMIGTSCATYGDMEKDYGKSFGLAKSSQILNPAAEANLKPVEGLSGAAGQENMNKYVQSFSRSSDKQTQNNNAGK